MSQPLLRILLFAILRLFLRIEFRGLEHLAAAGPRIVLACNHVSFADPLIVRLLFKQAPVYAIDTTMARLWWVRPALRFARTYAVEPSRPFAVRAMIRDVAGGAPLVIFPEGRLTMTGNLMKFYDGAAFIAARTGATLIPGHIAGAGVMPLTRIHGHKVRRRWFPKVTVTLGPAIVPVHPARSATGNLTAALKRALRELAASDVETASIGAALRQAIKAHGIMTPVLEDRPVAGAWTYAKLLARAGAYRRCLNDTASSATIGLLAPCTCEEVALLLAVLTSGRPVAIADRALSCSQLAAAYAAAGVGMVVRPGSGATDIATLHIEDFVVDQGHAVKNEHDAGTGAAAGSVAFLRTDVNATLVLHWLQQDTLIAAAAGVAMRLDLTRADKLYCGLSMSEPQGLIYGLIWPLLRGAGIYLSGRQKTQSLLADNLYVANVSVLVGDCKGLYALAGCADREDFYALRHVVALGARDVRGDLAQLFYDKFGLSVTYGTADALPDEMDSSCSSPRDNSSGPCSNARSSLSRQLGQVAPCMDQAKAAMRRDAPRPDRNE